MGYNVYRVTASQNEPGQIPINQALITTPDYQDRNFKFGEKYTYVVRSVSLGTLAQPVESLNSNSVDVTPLDTFEPSAPTGVSIAAAPGRLAIFFAANPEADIAGYLIYRATDASAPKPGRCLRLRCFRTTFTDETVDPGKDLPLYIVGVDAAGNRSQRRKCLGDRSLSNQRQAAVPGQHAMNPSPRLFGHSSRALFLCALCETRCFCG